MEKTLEREIDYIMHWIRLGYQLIPCEYGGKKPVIPWKKYQDNYHVSISWFPKKPRRNVAVLCGKVSGNLVVLDFDDLSLFEKFNGEKLKEETLVIETHRGYHVHFYFPHSLWSGKIPSTKLGAVELKGDGHLAMLPPSKHPKGSHYEIVSEVMEPMLIHPESVFNWLEENCGYGEDDVIPQTTSSQSQGSIPFTPPCIKDILKGVQKGERELCAFRLAIFYEKQGLSKKETGEKLGEWNQLNKPPLPECEVKGAIKSAYSGTYGLGCSTPELRERCGKGECFFWPIRQRKKKWRVKR